MVLRKSFNVNFWCYISLTVGVLLLAQEINSVSGHIGGDYKIFYHAAARFNLNSFSLYNPDSVRTLQGFLYPPPAVILFLPFCELPVEWSYNLFVLLLYASAFALIKIW